MTTDPKPPSGHRYKVEQVTVRTASSLTVGPDDQVFFVGSRDDLSLGGDLHDFVILRRVSDAN